MDTLFNTSFNLSPSSHNEPRVCLNTNTFELSDDDESGLIRLKLTLIETSGYGDQINKENSHAEILSYIDAQCEAYVQRELNVKRTFRQVEDTRVHVCLYFICPTGHSLKALDLNTMRALEGKVNVIPIIAKADTIGKTELGEFKRRVMHELTANNVSIYQFPIDDLDLNVSNSNVAANVTRV
jgi:septin 6/8/11